MPLLDSGELELGVNNAVDMGLAYRGPSFKIGGRNPFPHAPNLRLVMRGAPLMVAPVVRKDSPIKTMADARGKRVTGEPGPATPARRPVSRSFVESVTAGGRAGGGGGAG